MANHVSYTLDGSIARIAMDDGKRNALGPGLLAELDAAFDRAEKDRALVLLTGREGVFSAGFDLGVMKDGGPEALTMLYRGFALAERILGFPYPVVVACNGHALAMGAFLLLSADCRVGVTGPYKLATNEVAIGLVMPRAGVEICRQRLSPAHFTRAAALAETYTPESGLEAGFLDRLVTEGELEMAAMEVARQLAALDMEAHRETKRRVRAETLRTMPVARAADMADFVALGAKKMVEARARRRGTRG